MAALAFSATGTPLSADTGEIERFVDALFRYASEGGRVALRAFYDDRDGVFGIEHAILNGAGLTPIVDTAVQMATRAAVEARPVVFCPPVATPLARAAAQASRTSPKASP